jgi:replicative DNA helicase
MESKLLSKVLDEQNVSILRKGNITVEDFYTQSATYNFIVNYSKQYGEIPPFETVTAECPTFEYTTPVNDHFNFLIKSVKNATAKRKSYELLMKEAGDKFQKMQGIDFVNWLADEANHLKDICEVESGMGTDFATNGKERLDSYIERKENRSGRYIPTPYPSLTQWLGGGFELGDYILLNAYTNRGKSWLGSQIGVTAWSNGFGVLHYSPELSKSQQLDRLDTLFGHFNNTELKAGQLMDENKFTKYLSTFNDDNEIPYIVKTMGDLKNGLTLEVIEADLQANPAIQMVIIDGFNLIAHKSKGGSNRDAMSNTSRQLRQMFGKYEVAGLVVAQTPTSAEKENQAKDEAGTRIVTPPEIYQYSETVAVIQDACTVLTFDQYQGVGKLKLAKARTPFVGKEIELHVDFNLGWIREVEAIDYF